MKAAGVIEDALRETLAGRRTGKKASPVRLTTFGDKGLRPGVDLEDAAALLAFMWVTTDRDLARFPSLRWRHPLQTPRRLN